MQLSVYRHCAVVALVVACLGGQAVAGPVGPVETFEGDTVGSFPSGWIDAAAVDPANTAPKPSAAVVSTTDAFGNPTKALMTLPGGLATLPRVPNSRGIYRAIKPSTSYSMRVDVRVDRYSDSDPHHDRAACGCPPGSEIALDWAMQVGFNEAQGAVDLVHTPTMVLLASSRTQTCSLFAAAANVVLSLDLDVPATLETWYGAELDLDGVAGSVHSRITDVATGTALLDSVTSLFPFGLWDPAVDGRFDVEAFFAGQGSGKITSASAVIDNIDARIPEPATMLLLSSTLAVSSASHRRRRL